MQNNENYSGFDLTMYNLFKLLREMYYTRGETETNFLQKSGGVVSGSLTIQGNLVINGQSYTIDTENLRVGDYTITLAKDNEQTLTSMVGMVVPKYDGTNYGFFGWDADGYAYVGDLTNYDGTSAITLANNSSLQRISTIDTTNTVVASNGVIYVYDATSHCFKKPTNDNKYYVIRNGAFVETELFTEQKSKNIDNALYNLGAFDTISGNTITRQTGYVDLGSLNWLKDGDNRFYNRYGGNMEVAIDDNVANIKCSKYVGISENAYSGRTQVGVSIALSNNIPTILIYDTDYNDVDTFKASLQGIILQYKLASSYQKQVIPNQPLLNLDSNGCNFLREEWEKGLNLWNPKDIKSNLINSIDGGSFEIINSVQTNIFDKPINFKTNTQYTFSYGITLNDGNGRFVVYYTDNTTEDMPFGVGNAVFTSAVGKTISSIGLTYGNGGRVDYTNFMLVSGTHAYPYQEYNGAIVHKVDIEPVLLWSNPNYASQFDGINSMTIKDRSPYKYLKIFVALGAGNNIFQVVTLENAPDGYSTELSLGDGEKIWCREFKFLTSTTVKIGNGVSGSTTNNLRVIPRYIYGTNVL